MGRQVNFYMTEEDEAKFLEFVRTTGDVAILPYASPTRDFKPLRNLSDSPIPKFSSALWLLNHAVSENLAVRFVPTQGYYTVDAFKSSVVEYSRSGVKEKTVYRGRIWAEFFYPNETRTSMVLKEPAFKEWYDILARWIRKNYKRLEDLIYAGPGAQKLIAEGFTLK